MPIAFRASGRTERAAEWLDACVTIDTSTALDLLAFLGLEREEWGACEANDLAARLRRAQWPSRPVPNSLRPHVGLLLDVAVRARDGYVLFTDECEAAR
jgi:hypothetical protein